MRAAARQCLIVKKDFIDKLNSGPWKVRCHVYV